MNCLIPFSTQAFRTFSVPSRFTISNNCLFFARGTCATLWKTTSTSFTSFCRCEKSVTSHICVVSRVCLMSIGFKSMFIHSNPCANSFSISNEPKYPDPPVTSTLFVFLLCCFIHVYPSNTKLN